ncbi:MAG: hypothetical protein HY302_04595 [Opitutae bacterium]|nr:hypothetical protein [Opitutae bacterium]
MKILWWPILGAAGALVGVKIIGHYFGTGASAVALGVLLLSWWLVHLYYQGQLARIHAQLEELDEERKAEVLAQLDPEIRRDLASRAPKKERGVNGRGKR